MIKFKFREYFILFFFYSILAKSGSYSEKISNNVKIGILTNQTEVSIASNGNFSFFDERRKMILKSGRNKSWIVKVNNGNNMLCLNSKSGDVLEVGNLLYIKPSSRNKLISVYNKYYRGEIIILINKKSLINVINQLSVEDYIKGVITKEIGKNKHQELIKAQAVAARTQALLKLDRHKDEGFDLCSEVCCQVYGGYSAETTETNSGVDATKGEVLMFAGTLASTVYHACCGGFTEDAENVWGRKIEYLVSVPCFPKNGNKKFRFPLSDENNFSLWVKSKPRAYCENHGNFFRWEKVFSENELEELLNKKYPVGKLIDIKLGERGNAGTLKSIKIIGSQGEFVINKEYEIRNALGGVMKFFSGKFIVEKQVNSLGETNYVFYGAGWGHGVGMCQAGASRLASEYGWSYKKILKYYYPNTKVVRIY